MYEHHRSLVICKPVVSSSPILTHWASSQPQRLAMPGLPPPLVPAPSVTTPLFLIHGEVKNVKRRYNNDEELFDEDPTRGAPNPLRDLRVLEQLTPANTLFAWTARSGGISVVDANSSTVLGYGEGIEGCLSIKTSAHKDSFVHFETTVREYDDFVLSIARAKESLAAVKDYDPTLREAQFQARGLAWSLTGPFAPLSAEDGLPLAPPKGVGGGGELELFAEKYLGDVVAERAKTSGALLRATLEQAGVNVAEHVVEEWAMATTGGAFAWWKLGRAAKEELARPEVRMRVLNYFGLVEAELGGQLHLRSEGASVFRAAGTELGEAVKVGGSGGLYQEEETAIVSEKKKLVGLLANLAFPG